jgi:hypothetical protein
MWVREMPDCGNRLIPRRDRQVSRRFPAPVGVMNAIDPDLANA